MPPLAAAENAQSVREQANELIGLIDRLLLIKGVTITCSGGLRTPCHATQPSRYDPPMPVQAYRDNGVPMGLVSQHEDLRTAQQIGSLITALSRNELVVETAKAQLKQAYAVLHKNPTQRENFITKSVPEKLAHVLHGCHILRKDPVQTFPVYVVTAISPTGFVQSSNMSHQPVDISWPHFQQALTNATVCWQTVAAGFTTGLSVDHGRWFYNAYRNGRPVSNLKPLDTMADFERMKAELTVPQTNIDVWHERFINASNGLRREADTLLQEHGRQAPQTPSEPLEQQRLPFDDPLTQSTDEMWAQVRSRQAEDAERDERQIVDRFLEYDSEFPLATELNAVGSPDFTFDFDLGL